MDRTERYTSSAHEDPELELQDAIEEPPLPRFSIRRKGTQINLGLLLLIALGITSVVVCNRSFNDIEAAVSRDVEDLVRSEALEGVPPGELMGRTAGALFEGRMWSRGMGIGFVALAVIRRAHAALRDQPRHQPPRRHVESVVRGPGSFRHDPHPPLHAVLVHAPNARDLGRVALLDGDAGAADDHVADRARGVGGRGEPDGLEPVRKTGLVDDANLAVAALGKDRAVGYAADSHCKLFASRKASTVLKALKNSGLREDESGLTGPMVMNEYCLLLASNAECRSRDNRYRSRAVTNRRAAEEPGIPVPTPARNRRRRFGAVGGSPCEGSTASG